MRKSILIASILLCVGCQNKQASDNTPAKPAETGAETNIVDTTKDALPEANSAQTQDQAASELKTEEGSHEVKCGKSQLMVFGKCVCGSAKLAPNAAVTWDCVDDKFVCNREEGCTQSKEFKTVLNPPPKDDKKSEKADNKKDKAPAESADTDKCKDVVCGVHQTCEEGMCSCGGVKLSQQDAATWECVDERFRCYREAGCYITREKSTVLNTLDDIIPDSDTESVKISAKPYKKLIPLDSNAKYPDMPKRKLEVYQEPDFDEHMIDEEPEYCDGVICDYMDHICRDDICYEMPDGDFEDGPAYSPQGDGSGRPDDRTWVCNNISGCETKYGNYAFGEEFAPTGSYEGLSLDEFFEVITDKYPKFEKCLEGYSLSELSNRHFEIKNQYVCNDDNQFVCQLDKCCCGRGECSKGEVCTSLGECIIPAAIVNDESGEHAGDNKESEKKYKPTPKACGIYAKQKKLKRGEYRVDYEKMCGDSHGCKCGDTVCSKAAECHDGKCICAGVESPGEGYECKHWKWKCTDPEKCPPKKLYKQPYCGDKTSIGDGYLCRLIEDLDVPRPNYHNHYTSDYDPHYNRYEWECALSDGCKCGQTQCQKGESCINNECFCGRKRALAAPGWSCVTEPSDSKVIPLMCTDEQGCDCLGGRIKKDQLCYPFKRSKLICTQDEGCDCFGNPRKKGESCYLEENLFVDLSKDKNQKCGDISCPEGANCINGQCIFYSSPQKIENPGEYVSNWGFPQCNMEEGCACGENQCKKGEYCHQNTCMRIPTSIEVNGQMIEYVTFSYKAGKLSIEYNEKLVHPYKHTRLKGNSETEGQSGVDFVRQYGFERYYRTPHKDTCRGIPYPKNASGYVCLVGIKEWTSEYNESHHPSVYRYLPDEMLWMCNEKEGCACGKSKCKFKQTCIDKCYDIDFDDSDYDETEIDEDDKDDEIVNDDNNDSHDDDNTDDEDEESYVYHLTATAEDFEGCTDDEGCPCGKSWCYNGGKCYYNEFCYYDESYAEYSCRGDDGTLVKVNENGTCTDGKYLYAPDMYFKNAALGLLCKYKDKCQCGEIQCDKNQYCVEPGRCI